MPGEQERRSAEPFGHGGVDVSATQQAEFGRMLEERRVARGMTYRDVAAEAGVSASTVLRAERGEGDPTYLKLLAWLRDDEHELEEWRLRALRAEQVIEDMQRSLARFGEWSAYDKETQDA